MNNKLPDNEFLNELRNIDDDNRAGKTAALIGKWLKKNPLLMFKGLRSELPILANPGLSVVVNYTDITELLRRQDIFTVAPLRQKFERNIGAFFLGMDDSPAYQRQHSILSLAFSRSDLSIVRSLSKTNAKKLAEGYANGEVLDLVTQYGRILSAQTMQQYLGLDGIPLNNIPDWSRNLFRDIFQNLANDPAVTKKADTASAELGGYIDKEIEQRCGGDRELIKVIDRLLAMQSNDATKFPNDEIKACLLVMFLGSNELTSTSILNIIQVLMQHEDEMMQAIQAASENNINKVAAYCWEALRFAPAAPVIFRLCEEDFILARGTNREAQIKKGTIVLAATASVMHDETLVEAPEEFRINRSNPHYLHFGSGMHECFGRYFSSVHVPEAISALLSCGRPKAIDSEVETDAGLPTRFRIVLS